MLVWFKARYLMQNNLGEDRSPFFQLSRSASKAKVKISIPFMTAIPPVICTTLKCQTCNCSKVQLNWGSKIGSAILLKLWLVLHVLIYFKGGSKVDAGFSIDSANVVWLNCHQILLSCKWWSERSFTSITVICVVVVSYLCASHQSRFPNSHVWISKWLNLTFHVKIQRISLEIQRKIHGNMD